METFCTFNSLKHNVPQNIKKWKAETVVLCYMIKINLSLLNTFHLLRGKTKVSCFRGGQPWRISIIYLQEQSGCSSVTEINRLYELSSDASVAKLLTTEQVCSVMTVLKSKVPCFTSVSYCISNFHKAWNEVKYFCQNDWKSLDMFFFFWSNCNYHLNNRNKMFC